MQLIDATTDAAAARVSRRRLITLLAATFLFNVTGFAVISAAASVLLPTQVAATDPLGKVSVIGFLGAVGAIAAAGVPPIVGALSDRTRSRWGRRTPWILAGGVTSSVAFILLGMQTSLGWLALCWFLVHGTVNIGMCIVSAVVADRVPVRQLGLAGTINSATIPLGGAIGAILGARATHAMTFAYIAFGVAVLIVSLPLARVAREQLGPPDGNQPAHANTASLASRAAREINAMFAMFRTPDYRYFFAVRAMIIFGYSTAAALALYILTDYLKLPAGMHPTDALATLAVVEMMGFLLGGAIVGPLADRLGRRKIFVTVSALLVSIALTLPAFSPIWHTQLVAGAIGALGFGGYFAVDHALVIQVLPTHNDAGRDLGTIHIAMTAPQVLAAPFAAFLINEFGYPTLFLVASALVLVGSLFVIPIRCVR
ncbi:MFS transporter [Mycobacterium sp. OTB74]|uniref:MFS transporter n=1 Tax=Mycobacterium sp. OTB74 TaxID=1853452 RepID=UPI002473ECDB|nr:MFS transporter [Mycobacterium sp. OTB74]MDH6247566.1 MFS family permease [Mycobacterium sp. OTB74]